MTRRLLQRTDMLLLFAGMTLFVMGRPRTLAQEPVQSSVPPAATRACGANPELAASAKQKHAPKTKHPLPPEPLPACLEIKGEPMEVQETLQAIARDLQWRIHDNHATEDSWAFVRYVDTVELEKYADTKVLIQPVDFEDGKTAVVVRTTDIGERWARVQVSAHFEGEGKSSDATMKQSTTSWQLNTKGVLEKEMLSLLQARFRHVE